MTEEEARTLRLGSRVRHRDGREGMVERTQPGSATVQFEGHARSSVIKIQHLERVDGITA